MRRSLVAVGVVESKLLWWQGSVAKDGLHYFILVFIRDLRIVLVCNTSLEVLACFHLLLFRIVRNRRSSALLLGVVSESKSSSFTRTSHHA